MSYRIRPGTPADAEALTALRFACQAETYGPLYGTAFVASIQSGTGAAEEDRAHLEAPSANVQVAQDDDGVLVGFAIAADGPLGWECAVASDVIATRQLVSLYTRASTHGTGLGAQLMEAVLKDHDPAEPVYLWIMAGNQRADAFYRKHGFTQVDTPPLPAEGAWSGQFTYRMIRPGGIA
ncbi:GNAT family N-acetyltransferase [Kocuria sp.]|uniref:GNAT family N-acetyltransferase n=1 Tax=Kocuria sp. TaxID=1871328 RepID=UPI0026E01B1B|nr:GNAT family N-acetyltransferase [Kocuria sp.]MDO5619214.1 GNAT family N-acetyltransferase [Kocuria sp.]